MRRFSMFVAAAFVFWAGSAQASPIQIATAGALGANDSFQWGQVRVLDGGGNVTAQSSAVGVTSALGRSGSIADAASFTGLIEGADGLFADFGVGDSVLYTGDVNDFGTLGDSAFTIDFATPVAGLGLQIQSELLGSFTASLEAFNGATSLGVVSVSGASEGNELNTAPFLGLLNGTAVISRARFSVTSDAGTGGILANSLLTADAASTQPQPVPEPATLVLLGTGLFAASRRRK